MYSPGTNFSSTYFWPTTGSIYRFQTYGYSSPLIDQVVTYYIDPQRSPSGVHVGVVFSFLIIANLTRASIIWEEEPQLGKCRQADYLSAVVCRAAS